MERRMSEWLPAYAELRRLAEAGEPDAAAKVLSERIMPHYLAIGADATELAKTCDELMKADYRAATDGLSLARWLTVLLIAGGAIAGALAVRLMRSTSSELRSVASEMMEGSRQVAAAAGQVASSSQS